MTCSKTLPIISHLNPQQLTKNTPCYPGKQSSFVSSDTIPCGYLHANSLVLTSLTCPSILQGHHLWNGAQVISKYLQNHAEALVYHKDVLELGAGAGLPSLVAAVLGAQNVVVTDYPDADLISNLEHNIASCVALPGPTSIISTQASFSFLDAKISRT